MAGPRTYPHGVTCWIDTEHPDPRAACEFYAGLFGWILADAAPAGAPGPYFVATLGGRPAAAIGSAPGSAAVWNTYVAVNDADEAAVAVSAAGGTMLWGPSDVGPAGRAAACTDPTGAVFRLWQARERLGAQVTNEPGAWNFSDLHTPARDAAMAFYTSVFGWRAVDLGPDAGTMIQVPGYGDHLAGTVDPGIYERQATAPPGFADVIGGLAATRAGEPAHWHVTFTVADRDDTAAAAERLGAKVLRSADDVWTRNALVRDPQGAEFTVSQFTPPGG